MVSVFTDVDKDTIAIDTKTSLKFSVMLFPIDNQFVSNKW
jgi:hypothetical protein